MVNLFPSCNCQVQVEIWLRDKNNRNQIYLFFLTTWTACSLNWMKTPTQRIWKRPRAACLFDAGWTHGMISRELETKHPITTLPYGHGYWATIILPHGRHCSPFPPYCAWSCAWVAALATPFSLFCLTLLSFINWLASYSSSELWAAWIGGNPSELSSQVLKQYLLGLHPSWFPTAHQQPTMASMRTSIQSKPTRGRSLF